MPLPAQPTAAVPSRAADPNAPSLVWMNGELVPPAAATVNVFDHGVLYGDGVFEGIRIYNGRIFKLATHLRRLYASAAAIRLEIPYEVQDLTAAVRETVAANERVNGYIRLCVTRGIGALGLNPFTCERATVFIIAAGITLYPAEVYEKGLSLITAKTRRTDPAALSPRIKSMNYLNNILAKIEAIDAGVLEAVMLNSAGKVAECTADNLFIVRQEDGKPVVLTPPLSSGVLEGVTRQIVMELSQRAGLTAREAEMELSDLHEAEEMFMTGSAAEIVPVTRVDNHVIADAKPGRITLQLAKAFRELVADDAPED